MFRKIITPSKVSGRVRPWLRTRLLATIWLAILISLPALALEVAPNAIEFGKMDASETIKITADGKAVPASAIKSVKLYAGGHDYDEMIVVSKVDGAITVRPSDLLEIGSYDLVIDTTQGKATVSFLAPLDKLYTSLESRSARLGITIDELKSRLGLTQRLGQEYIELGIPKVYFIGQTMTFPIMTVKDRMQEWAVNGSIIERDTEGVPMQYTFTEEGFYDFTYVEKVEGRIVATGFGATVVVPEPPVHLNVEAGVPMQFKAPVGYAHYLWEVDGIPAGEEMNLTRGFETQGNHVVVLHAHTPLPGTLESLRRITYLVTAT